jgi:hypothetical protein
LLMLQQHLDGFWRQQLPTCHSRCGSAMLALHRGGCYDVDTQHLPEAAITQCLPLQACMIIKVAVR